MSKNKLTRVSVQGYRKVYSGEEDYGIDSYFVIILVDGEYKAGESTRKPPLDGFMIARIDNSEEPKAEYILY